MLIRMLPDEKKVLLVELAKLITLSDNQLTWNTKPKDELTFDSDLNNLTIQKNSLETEFLEQMKQSFSGGFFGDVLDGHSTEHQLTEKLKTYPLSRIDAPEARIQAATSILKPLLNDQKVDNPATAKIIIFQLLLVALRNGHISSIEWSLLKEIQLHFKIPDFIFKDLLDRAESLSIEMSKTLALVLE
ncbi:MAG: hypothetical protein E7J62_09775 [Serratia marcescens]|nr:hypothetical protein [Serratia marcescens]BEO27690.1 hypothetical protein SMQC21_12700 [Serratia marcescens]